MYSVQYSAQYSVKYGVQYRAQYRVKCDVQGGTMGGILAGFRKDVKVSFDWIIFLPGPLGRLVSALLGTESSWKLSSPEKFVNH